MNVTSVKARVKLVAFALGALAAALPLPLLLAVPESQPPSMVERIELGSPQGSEHGLSGSTHAAAAGRRERYGRGDRHAGSTARRGREPAGGPTPTLISTGQGGAQAQRTRGDQNAAADPPTSSPRGESAPRAGAPPIPREMPAPGTAAPREAPPKGAPPSEAPDPAEAPDPPDPPDPPDLPDETASPAAVDPPEAPEPPDGDPPGDP